MQTLKRTLIHVGIGAASYVTTVHVAPLIPDVNAQMGITLIGTAGLLFAVHGICFGNRSNLRVSTH